MLGVVVVEGCWIMIWIVGGGGWLFTVSSGESGVVLVLSVVSVASGVVSGGGMSGLLSLVERQSGG